MTTEVTPEVGRAGGLLQVRGRYSEGPQVDAPVTQPLPVFETRIRPPLVGCRPRLLERALSRAGGAGAHGLGGYPVLEAVEGLI